MIKSLNHFLFATNLTVLHGFADHGTYASGCNEDTINPLHAHGAKCTLLVKWLIWLLIILKDSTNEGDQLIIIVTV